MAEAYKVLGQANPTATTLTDVYTVPAATAAVISTITLANRSTTTATVIRLSVAPAGATDDNKQYTHYGISIPASETLSLTMGITLAATDVLRVYTSNASLAVNVFGVEIS